MNITAEKITERLTIPEVLKGYGLPTNSRKRIPCPIHNGEDNNFCYTDQVYHCWTCGASGNLINLVMELHGITFTQALINLDCDFSLGIAGRKPTIRERREMALNKRIANIAEALKADLSDYYSKVANIHRWLFKMRQTASLDESEARILDDYISSACGWLDDNLEEVMYPWII